MPRGEPATQPTKCSYCFLQGMCELHDEPGAKQRKTGSGGKYKADGITPRVVPRIHPDDKAAAKKARQKKYMESTVGTMMDNSFIVVFL